MFCREFPFSTSLFRIPKKCFQQMPHHCYLKRRLRRGMKNSKHRKQTIFKLDRYSETFDIGYFKSHFKIMCSNYLVKCGHQAGVFSHIPLMSDNLRSQKMTIFLLTELWLDFKRGKICSNNTPVTIRLGTWP